MTNSGNTFHIGVVLQEKKVFIGAYLSCSLSKTIRGWSLEIHNQI